MTHTNPFTFGALALDRESRASRSSSATCRTGRTSSSTRRGATASRRSCSVLRSGRSARDPRRLLRPDADADEGALRGRPREDDLQRSRDCRRAGDRAGDAALPRSPHHADDGGRSDRREPSVYLPRRQAARGGRRHDRGAARTSGQIAAERKRRAVLVFDEFQEIVTLDRAYPNLMRAVFQEQPEVGHVYLGSKRHVLERIFEDENEPFWRSAKRLEIGPIGVGEFARFVRKRFEETEKSIDDEALTGCSRRPEATLTGRRSWPTSSGRSFPPALRPAPRRGDGARAARSAPSTTTSPSSGTTRRTRSASSCSRWRRSPRARSTPRSTRSGTTSRRSPLSSGPSGRSLPRRSSRGTRTRLSDRRAVLRGLAPERAGGPGPQGELRGR